MNINTTEQENYCTLSLEGELDASCALMLDKEIQKIIEKGYKNILFDCVDLSYISSTGIGVFASHIEESRSGKLVFVLYGLNKKVHNVFEVLGINQLLPIVNSEYDAKKYINAQKNCI